MSQAGHSPAEVGRLSPVREIVRRWRALTGGRRTRDHERRTLLACSGGADSSALVLALASASRDLVVGHVLHDMRPEAQARADADAVRELARRVGLPCDEAAIRAREHPGNLEAQSRRLRYQALAEMARRYDCPYVATAHQADDQLETLLMRLMRGAGPRGLAGIAPSRASGVPGVTIVRPMLGLTRARAEQICHTAGWTWRADPTNFDADRLRAAVRQRLLPVLRELAPGIEARASRTAQVLRDAARLITQHAHALLARGSPLESSRGWSWPRERLRHEREVVLAEWLRQAYLRLHGEEGLDRRSSRLIEQTTRALRDSGTDPREFDWGPVVVRLTASTVTVMLKGD